MNEQVIQLPFRLFGCWQSKSQYVFYFNSDLVCCCALGFHITVSWECTDIVAMMADSQSCGLSALF